MAWSKIFANLSLLSVAFTVNALDLEGAKEKPCFNISGTVPFDPEFYASLQTVYNPMLSRLELYRTAADLIGERGSELPESDVYYWFCNHWETFPNGSFRSTGFKSLHKNYDVKEILPNLERFELIPEDGKGFHATISTIMTDNKSFYVAASCGNDGQMSWSVGSTYPSLTKETKERVTEKLIEVGFKKEYFAELRYDHCELEGGSLLAN